MRILQRAAFFIALLAPSILLSFNNDTTKNLTESYTQKFTLNQFEYNDSTFSLDNSIGYIYNYLPKTILGNSGLIIHPLNYSSDCNTIGFRFSPNLFSEYFYLPENLRFYNTRTPYTDLLYIMGNKKEQLFKTTFSINPKKNWNITADFNRIRSGGVYSRQSTNNNNLAISTNYKSKNNRYWLIGGLIYNSVKSAENGGITSDSAFSENVPVESDLLEVNLFSAKRANINKTAFLKQIINLGKKNNDTSAKGGIVIPGSRFILHSLFEDMAYTYQDDANDLSSGFYSNIYYDSSKTFDSTYCRKIENEIEWKRLDNGKRRGIIDLMGFSLNFKNQLVFTRQERTNNNFDNMMVGAGLYNTYSNRTFWWNVKADYDISGYNEGDYSIVASAKKGLKDSLTYLSLIAKSSITAVDYFYTKYRSNHFSWDNTFDKTGDNSLEANFVMNKYGLEVAAAFHNYTNVCYFDNFGIARQYKSEVPVVSAFLKKNFSLWNWHLDNKITYQYVPDSMVIRLPSLILDHSLYYENNMFKGAARVQIGVSVFYVTSYYANAYMPATGVFYLQDQKRYGDYPFLDFFVAAKVKSARIFFKIDNLNSGLTGSNYILTPNYPYPPRTFKLGISWRFYD